METVIHIRECSFRASQGQESTTNACGDCYDSRVNSRTFLLTDHVGKGIGTIRFSIFDKAFQWMGIPIESSFPELFQSFAKSSTPVVQSSYFAIHPGLRTSDLKPKLLLIRELHRLAVRESIDKIVTIVENKRSLLQFYERIGLKAISSPRFHPLAKEEAVVIGGNVYESLTAAKRTRAFALIAEGIGETRSVRRET